MENFDAKRAAIIWIGLRFSPLLDRLLARWSRLDDRPVYDRDDFDWIADLERNWTTIRDEAAAVLGDESALPPLRMISPDHRRIATDDRWKSFFLWGYGLRSEENCARCPATARLLEAVPGLLTALYSVLEPRSHIPGHTGPSKAIITAHLGLRIPQDPARCRMRIADSEYVWQEGRTVVFDDMYEHEVWNDTDEYRVVLMLQVKRPERFPGTLVRDAFLAVVRRSPFIQDARRNIDAWRQRGAA